MQSIQERIDDLQKANLSANSIEGLGDLRRVLMLKHGSITNASRTLNIPYTHLSAMLHGRLFIVRHVARMQEDLSLTDRQVLLLWPMLRTWPKEGRP